MNTRQGHDLPTHRNLSVPHAWMLIAIPSLVGLALAAAVSVWILFPKLGTGSTDQDRKIAIGALLDAGFVPDAQDRRTLVCLGDSVSVAGLDAAAIELAGNDASSPRWRVLHLGINGCNRTGLDVIVPLVARAKPDAACVLLIPESVVEPFPLPVDSAYAYNLGGFVGAWPDGWMDSPRPGISADAMVGLRASPLSATLHFRNAPQTAVNLGLRARFRAGIRPPRFDDWVAPFELAQSISGATLEGHLRQIATETVAKASGGTELHEQDLERDLMELRRAGVYLVLVAGPIHPELRAALSPYAERVRVVCERVLNATIEKPSADAGALSSVGIFIDASNALTAEDFADALHPNASGRAKLSQLIGAGLAQVDQDTAQPSSSARD
jgi:hypothetical protein